MAELAPLARPYARAVFELALETSTIEQWSSVLTALSDACQDKIISATLANTSIDNSVKAALIVDALADKISEENKRFLHLLAHNSRLNLLTVIERLYQDYVNEQMQSEEVEVYSAYPLQDAELTEIQGKISKNLNKSISLVRRSDTSLIGGVRVQGKGWVMDASIEGRVKALARSLTV